ncbi:MAG: hypothetical protein U0002_05825 [Thermoanaerobaculia bacterium]
MKPFGPESARLGACDRLARQATALWRDLVSGLDPLLATARQLDAWQLTGRPGRQGQPPFPPGGLVRWLGALLDPHVPALLAVLLALEQRFGEEPGLAGEGARKPLEPPAEHWEVWREAPATARLVVAVRSPLQRAEGEAARFVEEGSQLGLSLVCSFAAGRLVLCLQPLGAEWSEEEREFARETAYRFGKVPLEGATVPPLVC